MYSLTSIKVNALRSLKVSTLRSPKVNTLRDFAQHLRMIQIFKQNVADFFMRDPPSYRILQGAKRGTNTFLSREFLFR